MTFSRGTNFGLRSPRSAAAIGGGGFIPGDEFTITLDDLLTRYFASSGQQFKLDVTWDGGGGTGTTAFIPANASDAAVAAAIEAVDADLVGLVQVVATPSEAGDRMDYVVTFDDSLGTCTIAFNASSQWYPTITLTEAVTQQGVTPYAGVVAIYTISCTSANSGDTEGETLTISENGTPTDAVIEFDDESDLISSVTPPTGWTITGNGVGETNVQFTADAVGAKVLTVSAHSSDGTYSVAENQAGENAVTGVVEIHTITPEPTTPTGGTWKAQSATTIVSTFDDTTANIAAAIYDFGTLGIALPSVTGTLDAGPVTVEFVEEAPKSADFLSPENVDLTAPEITHSIT